MFLDLSSIVIIHHQRRSGDNVARVCASLSVVLAKSNTLEVSTGCASMT